MLKNVILAAAIGGLLAGSVVSLQITPAEAASGCAKAAKAKYPGDHAARMAYKKECKAAWKAHKSASKSA
jgi:hypothetical protein